MTLGQLGETRALEFLKSKNYRIVARNFRTRAGEIDLICESGDTLIFVEVKSRVGDLKGKPYESVNYYKLNHLRKAVYFYLLKNKKLDSKLRLDVVSIEFLVDHTIKEINHFENLNTDWR